MRPPPRNRALAAAALALALPATQVLWASSHREAPITALDEKADITDFYAFVSYDDPSKVTLIMNVDPLLEPGNGPNYFPFDPQIAYRINIDNDHDAVADIIYEFEFDTELRAPGFTAALGAGGGINAPANAPPPAIEGTPIVPPAITALAGPGSEGLLLRQQYSVNRWVRSGSDFSRDDGLMAVPSNAGPRTMPDYASLAQQGVYDLGHGVRVFAGTVDDPFYIDLGAAFDTFNLRQSVAEAVGVAGVLTAAQDAAAQNVAPDEVSGYNVNTIAVELPISMLTADRSLHAVDEPEAVIGTWASTRRPMVTTVSPNPRIRVSGSERKVQIQRLGNPLINELIIDTNRKDIWSRSAPQDDQRFAGLVLDPLLARVLNAATAGALPIPPPPRADLLPLAQYLPPICPGCTQPVDQGPVADLLRLNTAIPPTPAAERSRLGFIAGDVAGFPNGRRVSDDVVDIALRVVVGGVLVDPPFEGFSPDVHGRLGDGVNINDTAYQETFPYVGFAQSGRDSRHVDPGEPGCGDMSVCPVE